MQLHSLGVERSPARVNAEWTERMVDMKNIKAPTLAQKKYLKARGLAPTEWFVIKDTPELMEVVSRREIAHCRMRKVEGVDQKPRTRILRKEEA